VAAERFTLTRQGYERLMREFESLIERRDTYAEQLFDIRREAGLQPDDEATEYEARVQKEYLDQRIARLRDVLERAEVLDEDPDPQRIDLGDYVVLWDIEAREEFCFELRSSEEVSYLGSGVSVESPVGAAILGHRIGDVVEVEAPDGIVRYMVRRIERHVETT
jgi:transcription elongation factor GreA